MALGTNPLAPDAEIRGLQIRNFLGHVTVSIVRPAGVEGLAYSFDVASDPAGPWRNSLEMDRLEWATPLEDGMEEFHTVLVGVRWHAQRHYFARLRVEIE